MNNDNTKITDFLKSHPLISVKGLEETLKLPEGTVWKAIRGTRQVPKKHIPAVLKYLEGYGMDKK